MHTVVIVRDVRFTADAFYSVKEVAMLLGVSPTSVARWIASGKLKAVKLGDGRNAPVRVYGRTILALFKRVEKITKDRAAKQRAGQRAEQRATSSEKDMAQVDAAIESVQSVRQKPQG